MHHIGTDIIEIGRIRQTMARWGEKFLQRVYTAEERRRYGHKLPSLAARFAGKEAVVKALGSSGICWRDIEILTAASGLPLVNLYGKAREEADNLGLASLAISLSHSRKYAIAFAIGEREAN